MTQKVWNEGRVKHEKDCRIDASMVDVRIIAWASCLRFLESVTYPGNRHVVLFFIECAPHPSASKVPNSNLGPSRFKEVHDLGMFGRCEYGVLVID